jgi:hypothetical protein
MYDTLNYFPLEKRLLFVPGNFFSAPDNFTIIEE